MSLSLFVRKSVAFCSLAVTLPALLSAQVNLQSLDSEYGITPAARGDQVAPRIAINANGGFAVWQEAQIDGDGLGIRAVALDSSLRPAQQPFRINQFGRGDQENPQVALLPDGGAAFVWQSGRQGFQRIVGRFLSSSNTWVSSDIAISSYTRAAQRSPAISTLPNGNVVVVWTSYNQRGSSTMQDVYGQVLTPDGTKVGPEFTVNQFTAFNQRTPSVAALPDGRFIVAWISEQQRISLAVSNDPLRSGPSTVPSIDVYARIFAADGTSTENEMLINTARTICANPSVVAAADGSCLISWSQADLVKPANRWDIFSRALKDGQPAGEARLVNTHVYGDQFAPQSGVVGSTWLVVWTSMAQDGSQEGVFGQFLGMDLSRLGSEFRVNATILNAQKQPSVASDSLRVLVTWTTYVAGPASFDLAAQAYAVAGYQPVAAVTNYAVPAFVETAVGPGGAVDPGTGLPVLEFPLPAKSAGPLADGFALAKGSYRGLCYDTNGVSAYSSGYLTAQVTGRRTFSARVSVAGQTYAGAGKLDDQGNAVLTLQGPASASLSMNIAVDLAGGNQLKGTLTKGALWNSSFLADKGVSGNSSTYAGRYNILIPPGEDLNGSPAGYGFGSVRVNKQGALLLDGTLPDGTRVIQSSGVSRQGVWPLYSSLYNGKGVVLSWIQFTNGAPGGTLVWSKAASSGGLYPAGFTNLVEVSGSGYQNNPATKRAISLNDGVGDLIFTGGGLTSSFTNRVQLESNSRLTTLNGSLLNSFNIIPASGLFRGSIRNPETGKALNFQGSILQGENFGAGFFLGTNASGQVWLLKPAP